MSLLPTQAFSTITAHTIWWGPIALTTATHLQSTLQTKYTGGTVLHLYMGQRISSAKVCRDIVRRVLTNYRLPYITITPTFSICPKHGYISGEHKYCPICDEEKKAIKRAAASRKDVA